MNITRKQTNELFRGLSNLSDSKKEKKLKVDSDTLWKIAVNLRRVKNVQERTEQYQQELIFSLADGTGRIPPGEKSREFRDKQEAYLNQEMEVNLSTFLKKDFRLNDNDISPEILCDLAILIDDFDPAGDES